MARALIAVDVQFDFLPGGALAVPHGDEVVPVVERLSRDSDYGVVIATRDWHPANHVSFEAQGGSWPPHCVKFTDGARFAWEVPLLAVVVSKGQTAEAYSGFAGDTNLAIFLGAWGVTDVDVVGLALDYCVKATALDAAALAFNTRVLLEGTRAVNPADVQPTLADLKAGGVEVVP